MKGDTTQLVTVTDNGRSVKVDVTDEGARKAKALGSKAQLELAHSLAKLFGFTVEERPLTHRGKRGVSNAGFTAVLWKTEETA